MELDITKNKGVIINPRPTDYVQGVNSPIVWEDRNQTDDWTQFNSPGESQNFPDGFDAMDCVTGSALDQWESQANWMLQNNLWPQAALDFFNANGYISNGKFVLSRRFTAKKSGTTPAGNYAGAVHDSIRNDGVVPFNVWGPISNPNWTTYYADIPDSVTALGKQSLQYFTWLYENLATDIETLRHELFHAPIQIIICTCPGWNSGTVPICGGTPNHAILLNTVPPTDALSIFDQYNPYNKTLEPGYTVYNAVKAVLYPAPQASPNFQFGHNLTYGEQDNDVGQLQARLTAFGLLTLPEGSPPRYGPLTTSAVKALMLKYNIGSWWEKYIYPAGRQVGPKIRAWLNTN